MIDFTMNETSMSFTALREALRHRYSIGSGRAKVAIDQAVKLGLIMCENNRYLKIMNSNLIDQTDDNDPFA